MPSIMGLTLTNTVANEVVRGFTVTQSTETDFLRNNDKNTSIYSV